MIGRRWASEEMLPLRVGERLEAETRPVAVSEWDPVVRREPGHGSRQTDRFRHPDWFADASCFTVFLRLTASPLSGTVPAWHAVTKILRSPT